MGRPCSVCKSPKVKEIDLDLLAGGSVSAAARDFEMHESSIRRHLGSHLPKSVLRDLRATESTSSPSLLERLVEVLGDVDAVRSQALMSGDAALVLKAAAATKATIETILSRTGTDDVTVVDDLAEMHKMARAFLFVAREHPRVGLVVAAELRRVGADEGNAQLFENMPESVAA